MAIYTKYTNGGSTFTDASRVVLVSAMNGNNSASSFEAYFPNNHGEHSSDFHIGDQFQIYADQDVNPATTLRFVGIVENVQYHELGDTSQGDVVLRGRDYSSRLQDATVQPVVYNNTEIGSIVRNIVTNNVSGISTTNVATTQTTLNKITFNHTPVFDAISQLADTAQYMFYVDNNQVLNFTPVGSVSSNVTLSSGNVTESQFRTVDDSNVYNQVWVYGNRVLTHWKQVVTANGGSVYTLNYQPNSTEVYVGGSTTPKVGGVWNATRATPGSPYQYLVDKDNSQIIFISGTSNGANVPVSGSDTITIEYDKQTPIAKYGENTLSKNLYGAKTKVIIDKNINDPYVASQTVQTTLQLYSMPMVQGDIRVYGIQNVTPGQTVTVNMPNEGITNKTYSVIQTQYDFNAVNNFQNNVQTIRVSRKINDFTDTVKQMILDIKKLQAQDISSTDVITRLQFATGSSGFKCGSWFVKTRLLGSSFILASTTLGILGTSQLGDARGAWTVQYSGGESLT